MHLVSVGIFQFPLKKQGKNISNANWYIAYDTPSRSMLPAVRHLALRTRQIVVMPWMIGTSAMQRHVMLQRWPCINAKKYPP